MYCENCGEKVNVNDSFCANCGVSLKKSSSVNHNDNKIIWIILGSIFGGIILIIGCLILIAVLFSLNVKHEKNNYDDYEYNYIDDYNKV